MELRSPVGSTEEVQNQDKVFDGVFQEYQEQVFNLCCRITGNHADAEDALQDAMVSVYRSLHLFRGDAELSTWIHRIAIHASLRICRRRQRRSMATLPSMIVSQRASSDGDDHERLQQVIHAMNMLPDDYRVVLHLFAIKSLRHAEIAKILGIPEGTVWSRLHRARTKLKDELEKSGGR